MQPLSLTAYINIVMVVVIKKIETLIHKEQIKWFHATHLILYLNIQIFLKVDKFSDVP